MFTDGLDPSALKWVQQGVVNKDRETRLLFKDVNTSRVVTGTVLDGRKKSKRALAGLPPAQLQSARFHSSLITTPTLGTTVGDTSSDSIGSASATENHDYEDTSDSEDRESGRYSLDSSPHHPTQAVNRSANVITSDSRMDCRTADDYYYEYDKRLLRSRSNSRSESRRDSFAPPEGRPSQPCQAVKDHRYRDDQVRREHESDGEDVPWDRGTEMKNSLPMHASTSFRPNSSMATIFNDDQGIGIEVDVPSIKMTAPPSAPPMMRSSAVGSEKVEAFPSTSTCSQKTSFGRDFEENENIEFGATDSCVQAFHGNEKFEPKHEDTCTNESETTTSAKQPSTSSSSQQHSLFSSGHAPWSTVIAYEACVRLCLRAWARGCGEAPEFLINECSLLRTSFGIKHMLLQPREEISQNSVIEDPQTIAASKQNKDAGKLRVQVRKVRLASMRTSPKCSFPNIETTCPGLDFKSDLIAGLDSVKKLCKLPRQISRTSFERGNGYIQAGAHYMRQVSGILKASVNSLRNTSLMDIPEETHTCILRLKSMPEEEAVRMNPGSGDSHIFHPESLGDDLIIEVLDSKGCAQGKAVVQLVSLSDDQNDRLRWWSILGEQDQECTGKVQLFINYIVDSSSSTGNKMGIVSETLAYDILLETAMRIQKFQPGNLRLYGSWKWLLSEFAVCYGVSGAYSNLRYLSYVMEIATPTEDCFLLMYELLYPIMGAQNQASLSRQEKRIMHDVLDQVEQLLSLAFENYKSLDESSPSGVNQHLTPIKREAAPALSPAVKLYTMLHDVLSPETQINFRNYFQTAAIKRCRRQMTDTDEFVTGNNDGILIDPLTISGAYSKMVTLCNNLSIEIEADIQIHNQHILPSAIDLPSIVTGVYSVELCKRLKSFLVACPPSGPRSPVIDLLIATSDFEGNLLSWNIRPVKGGVDAKDLFHLYIVLWIQDKRLNLLEFCKLDKVRWTGVTTQHGTSPFVEDMYERLRETLNEYDALLNRWPEYTYALEGAVADVETAVVAALEKQFTDVLTPLKDVMVPKKFSIQYVQKLTRRRNLAVYSVPNQLGIFLNTIKRLLDVLRPKIEHQMRAWVACLPAQGNERGSFGERLNEVTVLLRAKYKNFLQAIVEKLFDNSCMQRTTKLKKILQDSREAGGESEIRDRMQLLSSQLTDTITHLHDVFSSRVFVAVCRGYWDRMGQDVLHFLETRKENRSWYKGSWYALTILDDVFASQMQKMQGHSLQEKDLEPPRSVMDARSLLSKDAQIDLSNDTHYPYF